MSYRFQDREPLEYGIKRMAREQLRRARSSLLSGDNRHAAIHDARKRLKKVRAVLKLVRDEIGQSTYRRENRCFRAAGLELAALRDAHVAIRTLDRLQSRFAGVAVAAFAALREQLERRYELVVTRDLDERRVPERVAETLSAAGRRIEEWPIRSDAFEAVRPGLRRVYRRGRRRMREAYAAPSHERFHEWRKQAKTLWYHSRILTPLERHVMTALAEQLRELSELIGDAHDVGGLLRLIDAEALSLPPDDARLIEAMGSRTKALHSRARPLGESIWSETGSEFADRVGDYWDAWRRAQPIRPWGAGSSSPRAVPRRPARRRPKRETR